MRLHSKWDAQCPTRIVRAMGTIAQWASKLVGVTIGDPPTVIGLKFDRGQVRPRVCSARGQISIGLRLKSDRIEAASGRGVGDHNAAGF